VIARAIHKASPHRKNRFVALAWKGRINRRRGSGFGRFQLADRGTLLLDEIGDLPLELQPKLLRVVQGALRCCVGVLSLEHVRHDRFGGSISATARCNCTPAHAVTGSRVERSSARQSLCQYRLRRLLQIGAGADAVTAHSSAGRHFRLDGFWKPKPCHHCAQPACHQAGVAGLEPGERFRNIAIRY